MIELNERAEQFLHSIRAEGEKSCAAIRAETDKQVAKTLEETRKAEQARAERTMKFESERARIQANRSLSEANMQARTQLAAHRNELANGVFADARAKLADFTATAEYAGWLSKAAEALVRRLGKGTVLYARPADAALLQGKLPAGATLQTADDIQLGGLRAENGALAADDTLESRLEAQHDWFLQNAELSLTI